MQLSAIAVSGMAERTAPSRPVRLGTRRRRAERAAHQAQGDSGRNAATSLDTEKTSNNFARVVRRARIGARAL